MLIRSPCCQVLVAAYIKASRRSALPISTSARSEGVGDFTWLTVALLSGGVRNDLCMAESYQDRELRIQVLGPFCVPLYTVEELDVLQVAFLSLVEGSYASVFSCILALMCSPSSP